MQKVIDNMWHAYIYAQIADVHIFVIHFSPHQVIKRRAEIRQILAHAALLPQDEKIVITGDFNSYAPLDSLVYDADRLKAYREIQKKHKHIRNLDNGQFDYSVIGSIEKAGYTDLQKSLAKHLSSMEVIVDSKTKKLSDHFPSHAIFNFSGFSECPVTR